MIIAVTFKNRWERQMSFSYKNPSSLHRYGFDFNNSGGFWTFIIHDIEWVFRRYKNPYLISYCSICVYVCSYIALRSDRVRPPTNKTTAVIVDYETSTWMPSIKPRVIKIKLLISNAFIGPNASIVSFKTQFLLSHRSIYYIVFFPSRQLNLSLILSQCLSRFHLLCQSRSTEGHPDNMEAYRGLQLYKVLKS